MQLLSGNLRDPRRPEAGEGRLLPVSGGAGELSARVAEGDGGPVASAVSPPAQRWLSSSDKICAGGAETRRGPGGGLCAEQSSTAA